MLAMNREDHRFEKKYDFGFSALPALFARHSHRRAWLGSGHFWKKVRQEEVEREIIKEEIKQK